MNNSVDQARKDILDKLKALVNKKLPPKQVKLIDEFIDQYYINVSLDDLIERTIADLYGAMLSHWNLAYQRNPGECKIRVYNPHFEQDGWQSTHTIVEVATDDMPFLVDSMRMEINRQGFSIHFTAHLGNMRVKRDAKGQVTEILPDDAPKKEGGVEALIYMEIDRESDQATLSELKDGLQKVLADVQVSVEDWRKMRERMEECIADLDRNPPPFEAADIAESKDFLHWLIDDHFTFLGCRDYKLSADGKMLQIVSGSGLGVLRDESKSKAERPIASLPPAARELAFAPQVLVISKTNTKATVHRSVYTDYIGVKLFNKKGEVCGERRFIGLYTSTAYHSHPKDIPLLRRKVDIVMESSKLPLKGHSGKALLDILASLPRDDLFQATPEELTDLAIGVLHIQERQRIRLFVRKDTYQRFVSCLVYVPRERFNTELRHAMEEVLMHAFSGLEIGFSTLFSESALARVHFLIRTDPKKELHYDVKEIESELIEVARSWKDELRTALTEYYGEERGTDLVHKYINAFPASYRDTFTVRTAVYDIEHIEKLSATHTLEMSFYHPIDDVEAPLRFKLFQANEPIVLSDVLPVLENLGLRVIDEWPQEIIFKDGSRIWINDFGMKPASGEVVDVNAVKDLFQDAFRHIWQGEAASDGFNRLVIGAQLTWREAVLLRAYTKYLRQIGFPFSQPYVEKAVARNAHIARMLVDLFKLYFDPNKQKESAAAIPALEKSLHEALDAVVNLDEDRILRHLLEVIRATLRTNYFQRDAQEQVKPWISFKLNPNRIADLPLPRPLYEIFVYSSRVEGIHLRAAKVARGGLRWSDRREDFRTEILGLMKAQQVKNAVIVPAGAKGGFVCKQLPIDGTREAVMKEVVSCYQTFIRGLLDLTDNLVNGNVVPPQDVVRYDEDDPYLVVAADKGTATFSDIANAISAEYQFWLGDAFASGGSAGYDHKKMGITARGAWESVKRHFRTLGMDPAKDDFTVVGIGDMSGDVFGNGMLLSHHIKLVAAFNHEHIFLDPTPDPAKSFEERKRLFDLPRSSWADYDAKLISQGGGVFKRSLKSIPLSPEVKALLELKQDSIEPDALIRACLTSKVDLLWNGGIGTYVKATQERHVDVGDRTNDALRVNGGQLNCRIVAEGGNLGFTQLGRVEYALNNGLIYTDFIDNSAGVDCSDHEVNCKILLNAIVTNGDLTLKQRNQLLAEMTDEVAELVLYDNYSQTRIISLSVSRAPQDLELYRRYLGELERAGKIDRALEFLPDEKAISERKALGKGFTSPEIAILLAYTKIVVKASLLQSDVIEDPYLMRALELAFPKPLREKYRAQMEHHSLRREIIATQISNAMINDMGITFVYRLQNETGSDLDSIVRAYSIARSVLSLSELTKLIDALGSEISPEVSYQLMWQVSRLIRRASRWFLRNRKNQLNNIAGTIERFKQGIAELNGQLPKLLLGEEREDWDKSLQMYRDAGVPETSAIRMAGVDTEYALLDIIEAAIEHNLKVKDVAAIYFSIGHQFEFAWLRAQIIKLPVESHWDTLARVSLLDDIDTQQRQLTVSLLQEMGTNNSDAGLLDKWMNQHKVFTVRWQQLLADLRSAGELKFMMFSVVVRELIALVKENGVVSKKAKIKTTI